MNASENTCDGLEDADILAASQLKLPPAVPPLTTFYLYLSAGCNLHCRHCWITPTFANGKPLPAECLDFGLLKEAVAEAKPMGLRSAKLTGGEPVLHPEFIEIAEYLADQDLRLTMETNATLIDQQMAKRLHDTCKLASVAVSLDSPDAEQHDQFRGRSGAFDKAVRGITNLVEAGFRPQIIMSVYRGNIDQIDQLIELAIRLGAGSVKFNPVTASGRGAEIHQQGQGLDFEELISLTRRIQLPSERQYPIPLCIMIPPALQTVKEILFRGGSGGSCHVRHILGLLGTGEMALCGIGRNVPELCFGRLGKDSLRDVWTDHPTLVQMRKDLEGPFPGLCGDCIHASLCLTHCLAMNYEANGSLVSVSPLCAEAERAGVFPATRRVSWEPSDEGQPTA